MASPAPAKKRTFRLGRVLLLVLLMLLLLIGATVIFRAPLATLAAKTWFESQGIEVRSLEVTTLSPDVTVLRDIVLGAEGELTIEGLLLEPNVLSAEAPLHAVAVHRMKLRLDATGRGPLLGSLQPFVDRFTGGDDRTAGDQPPMELPDIGLRDSLLVIQTPSGPMTADLEGDFSESSDGTQSATASLDLDSELGRLQGKFDARRNTDGALQLTATIAEGRFAWQGFALGAVSGRLEMSQAPGEAPRLDADLDLSDLAYAPPDTPPLHLATGHLTVDGAFANAAINLVLDGESEHLDLALSVQQGERQQVSVTLEGELRTAGGLARFLPLPGPRVTAGTLVVQAEGDGTLAGDPTAAATWADPASLLGGSRLDLQGDAILGGLALADGTTGVSAHLPLVATLAEDALVLELSDDAEVRVERPARDSLAALGVPADLLPLVASGLNLTLAAQGETPFRLTAGPAWPPRALQIAAAARAASDQGLKLAARSEAAATLGEGLNLTAYDGTLDARAEVDRLAIAGREARGVVLALPLDVDYGATGLHLALLRAGALDIRQFGTGAPLRLQNPLSLTVEELALDTDPNAAGYRYRLRAAESGASLAITAAEAEPVPIAAEKITASLAGSFAPARGHDADLEVRLGGFALPGYDFTAEAATVAVTLDSELRPATSRFSLGPFQAGGDTPLTAPLALEGELKRAGGGYDVTGELGLAEGQPLADLAGRYNDDGTAEVKAVSRLLSFAPDGLQPGDLSPLLGDLEEVRGGLTASARLAWPRDPASESARLTLSRLSFTGQGFEVSGLDLDLSLQRLQPPVSAPGQRLTVDALQAGVPVEDVAITFALDQAPGPGLALAEGGFGLAGARWRIEPTRFDPAATRNRVVLATEALDLATFFDLIGIDGLSGSGTLHGRLPVLLAGGEVIVEDGHFEAEGPGHLSIRFQALRSALAGGGETVELAAKALEDFRYEELTLDLAKTADNDATVKLSTLGANPEVLEGQPFRFNINLESNLTSVLEALQKGMSLSDEALRRAWRLRE